ncbi:CPBP family intramembrane metalloprotease [Streptomyces sp. CHD11]|uniref:CPBP family intramembrane glutamic endopeptidase n=1 Tax=Streptomyces sp. CHD11 TaxID=2741325 RepID=UPI001BFC32B5|nr:type II CAAX endopeptidase family protein [Streptomyces sp. CHD11]MBT3153381.1 CPBP family intramembrane metalloprotease [Streptomyces sp. CHD11]
MRVVWQLLAVVAVSLVGGRSAFAVRDNPWLTLVVGGLTVAAALFVYAWVVRRTERRTVTELAREGAVTATGRGLLIGVAMFGAVIANIALLGHYETDGLGSVTGAVGLAGFMAAAAVTEELLFRGVLFRVIEERAGTWIALAPTSVLFGLWHMANPDATLWGAVVITLGAGTMLAAAYAATRSLWVPIGVHFGWNYAASGIFSTEVSGNDTQQGLLDASTSGPTLISGGDFGPEASGYALLFGVLLTIAFLWLARRRGNLVPRAGRADRVDTTVTLPR